MILLIRHCTPNINYGRCEFSEASERIKAYNFTQDIFLNEITSLKPQIDIVLGNDVFDILTSSSPRALRTAQFLFHKKTEQIIISDAFVEFDLRVFHVPILKGKLKTWMLISRIMWALGLLKTHKSFSQERLRAKNGADLLIKRSQRKSIALVSHGLLNYFIEKNLKKSGYKRAEKIELGCFSITKLQLDKQ